MRMFAFWAGILVVLGTINTLIFQKEMLRNSDQSIFLALAPRDPRSMFQGDYMALTYEVENDAIKADTTNWPIDGQVVIKLDARKTGSFVRLHGEEALAAEEHLLRYRKRGTRMQIGPPSYFFQEGQGARYEGAKFGELKVNPSGDTLLVGLRGAELEKLR